MAVIKSVAVIGASGNLGVPVVQALLDAGFSVTALTRESSTATFPAGVAAKKVDYSSETSVTEALRSQDAVVSILASAAVRGQRLIIDAAVAAGVKRFIPSEFGINTRALGDSPISKILGGKTASVNYLIEKSKEDPGFTWTGLSTGLFFDFGLEHGGIGLDPNNKTAIIIDSGNEKWAASNLPHIGRAVAAILQHPEETANKYLFTASFLTSQAELLKIAEEETGSKFTVTHEKSEDVQKRGEGKLAKGDFSAFRELVRVHNFKDGIGNTLRDEDSANKLLGLPTEDVRASVQKWLVKIGAV